MTELSIISDILLAIRRRAIIKKIYWQLFRSSPPLPPPKLPQTVSHRRMHSKPKLRFWSKMIEPIIASFQATLLQLVVLVMLPIPMIIVPSQSTQVHKTRAHLARQLVAGLWRSFIRSPSRKSLNTSCCSSLASARMRIRSLHIMPTMV